MSEDKVEDSKSPAETPAADVKKPAAKKPAPAPAKKSHNFDLDDETVHRQYFIPPPGYVKPKFPSSI